MMHEKKAEPTNTFSVDKRKKLDWREVISLKHSAEEVWDTETVNAKRDWGKLLHYTLAEIHYAKQTEEVIAQLFKSGKFEERMLKRSKERILLFDTNTFLQKLFFLETAFFPINNKKRLISC